MTEPVSYHRIHADSAGESRIERLDLAMRTQMFAPPAAPLDLSDPEAASTVRLLRLAVGWFGDWHPTPVRQWFFYLAGEATMLASDGSQLTAVAGSIVLVEDTTGKGHQTRVIGNADVIVAAVQVPAR